MKNVITNILLATDFSEPANNALQTAAILCVKHKAVLHLVHVVENRYLIHRREQSSSLSEIMKQVDEDARARLYNVYEAVLRKYGIAVQIHMPTGVPYNEICKAADEMPIDLIVMGTHGASGFRELFMGTTAYSVIKNTTVPVLTIPPFYTKPFFEKILFPVRVNQKVDAKFSYLQLLLTNSANTSLHIALLTEKHHETEALENKDEIHNIIRYLKKNNILHTKEVYGAENPAKKVLELVAMYETDLIVINSDIDYKWTQFFVGPYTQQVINHSSAPVLSFRQAIDVPTYLRKEEHDTMVKKISGL